MISNWLIKQMILYILFFPSMYLSVQLPATAKCRCMVRLYRHSFIFLCLFYELTFSLPSFLLRRLRTLSIYCGVFKLENIRRGAKILHKISPFQKLTMHKKKAQQPLRRHLQQRIQSRSDRVA